MNFYLCHSSPLLSDSVCILGNPQLTRTFLVSLRHQGSPPTVTSGEPLVTDSVSLLLPRTESRTQPGLAAGWCEAARHRPQTLLGTPPGTLPGTVPLSGSLGQMFSHHDRQWPGGPGEMLTQLLQPWRAAAGILGRSRMGEKRVIVLGRLSSQRPTASERMRACA